MKTINNERGGVLVFVVIGMLAMIALTGLVIDGGMLYMEKSHLKKVANAAVLSGAQELKMQDDDENTSEKMIKEIVDDIVAAHNETNSLENCHVYNDQKVIVEMSKQVPLAFSTLFGIDFATVKVRSVAEIGQIGSAYGVAPLGVDESIALNFMQEYKLKVDQTEVDSGNFGILALGGPGAQTYEYNLKYGYPEKVSIGDVIDTQTGNIAGKTRSGVQEKVNACNWSPGMQYSRDCERIILVNVYKPYQVDQNQVKQVQVTGFAYFFITKPMAENDTSVTGMFIKMAGKGEIEAAAKNKGAYGIRLTE
ncbi:pilus assembly protein TadG-related protein [Lottiidibacillus patelloidae]|uniref:pilus assembly protein TadG-related protein n=1 Tax=Lottiidibacillus patelloidae TaxID=2670334 RepID=UPI001E2AB084|nr:Tad domain-containing protein [Lottiidibacillus patelloidae]